MANSENLKNTVINTGKKIATGTVITGILLSTLPIQELFGDEKNISCPTSITTKLLGLPEKNNGEAGLKRFLMQNNNEKFFSFVVPYGNDPWTNTDTKTLAAEILKKKNWIPQLVVNDDTSANYPGKIYEQYEKVIIESTKKNQSLGTFSANLEGKKVNVEFKPNEGQSIGNTDLTLEAYVYRNWVNISPPNENGQTTHEKVLIELPIGLERKVKPNENGLIEESFDIKRLSEEFKNQEGVVVVLKKAGKTVGTGLFEFARAEGIDKPASYNWKDKYGKERPEVTIDLSKADTPSLPEYLEETGLTKMTLSVKNVKGLKRLEFEINQTKLEKDRYEILAGEINKKLKGKAKLSFDPKTRKAVLDFFEEITAEELDLIDIYEHITVGDPDHSCGHEMCKFKATGTNGNETYSTRNEIIRFYPNQRNTKENPKDFNKDTWLNATDFKLLYDVFGSQEGDKNWKAEYDIYKIGASEGRIDLNDILVMLKAVEEQDKLAAEIKAANPNAILPELSIDVDSLLPAIQLTGNNQKDIATLGQWMQKRDIYKDTIGQVKEIRKAGELQAV